VAGFPGFVANSVDAVPAYFWRFCRLCRLGQQHVKTAWVTQMQLTNTPNTHPSPTPTSITSIDFGFFVPPLLHIFMLLLLAGSFQMNKIKHVELVWGFVLFWLRHI
jgi:hypothetical protein